MSAEDIEDDDDLFNDSIEPVETQTEHEHSETAVAVSNPNELAGINGVAIPGLEAIDTPMGDNSTSNVDSSLQTSYQAVSSTSTGGEADKTDGLHNTYTPALNGSSVSLGGHSNGTGSHEISNGANNVAGNSQSPKLDHASMQGTSKLAASGVDEAFLAAAAANRGSESAEWQYDSSDVPSSDDSSDSSSSSDDESEGDDDYTLLDPAEQARILMEGDGGSDEEEDGSKRDRKNAKDQPRTANEKIETEFEKPNVTIGPDMQILELGVVERIVDNFLLVKGTLSGETQVLESGSVLCLEDRTVIGSVFEPLGRVQEPRYSVAFNTAAEIDGFGIANSTKIFYVVQHSHYVFTRPLHLVKGSDASNVHDEEVAEHEVEFSDDEAEAEYKRKLKLEKLAKKGILPAKAGPRNSGKQSGHRSVDVPDYPSGPMKYDDDDDDMDEDDDGMYKPLTRPENFHQMANMERAATHGRRGHPSQRPSRGRNRTAGRPGSREKADRRQFRGDRKNGHHGGRHDHHHARPHHAKNSASPNMNQGHPQRSPSIPLPHANPSMPAVQSPPSGSMFPNQQNMQNLASWYNGSRQMTWNQGSSQFAGLPVQQQQQQQQHTNPVGVPAGSYVNPAFYQNPANFAHALHNYNQFASASAAPSNNAMMNAFAAQGNAQGQFRPLPAQLPGTGQGQAGQAGNQGYDPSRPWLS